MKGANPHNNRQARWRLLFTGAVWCTREEYRNRPLNDNPVLDALVHSLRVSDDAWARSERRV
jgi:hypothetical protein